MPPIALDIGQTILNAAIDENEVWVQAQEIEQEILILLRMGTQIHRLVVLQIFALVNQRRFHQQNHWPNSQISY